MDAWFNGRVKRCGLRAAAVVGSAVALGAGYAAAASMGSMNVFSTALPGIPNYGANAVAASDRGLLFSEGETNAQAAIGAITPSGSVSMFDPNLPLGSAPNKLAEDAAGNIWFADEGVPSAIGKIAPTGETTEFPLPWGQPLGLAVDAGGDAWFAEGTGGLGKVTTDGQITRYANGLPAGAQFYDVAAGSDGAMWFTFAGSSTHGVGKITPDGAVTLYTSGLSGIYPYRIALGPDGDMWFTDDGPEISKITPSGQITLVASLAGGRQAWEIAAAPDGNMWFTDMSSPHMVGKVTPTGSITEFATSPSGFSFGPALATGPDGDLWVPGYAAAGGVVGQLDVGAPPASTAPPAVVGSHRPGDVQSCEGASWSAWAGQQPSTTANSFDGYQWLRDGNPIAGQTAQSYTLTAADAGHELSCKLTATYTLFPATVSATSAAISVLAVVPDAPTDVTAAAGDGQAILTFAPPVSNGGASVNSYTVTASPGGQSATGPASPITMTGLNDGTSYTFTVTATNSAGTGPASAASSPVTPVASSSPGSGGSTSSATVPVAPATTTIATTTLAAPTPPPVRKPAAADHINGTAKSDHLTGTGRADVIKGRGRQRLGQRRRRQRRHLRRPRQRHPLRRPRLGHRLRRPGQRHHPRRRRCQGHCRLRSRARHRLRGQARPSRQGLRSRPPQLDRNRHPGIVETLLGRYGPEPVRFFAVGTNMDEELLRNWISSPRRLTIASLSGFTLSWHKRSSDGGKLAPLHTGQPEDVVWGVVYEVDGLAWQQIDEGQRGAGYREERVTVVGPDGAEHDASVYVARAEMIDDSILPMRSYRDPIVTAARANGLPAEYVDELARTPVAES